MLSAVVSMVTPTSRVAGLLPGDQSTRFALGDGLGEGKGKRRHQGEEKQLRMHDG